MLHRHNGLLHRVAGLVERWTHQTALKEQRVPAWDRPAPRGPPGQVEQAVVDVEYQDSDGRRWVDVSVHDRPQATPERLQGQLEETVRQPGEERKQSTSATLETA